MGMPDPSLPQTGQGWCMGGWQRSSASRTDAHLFPPTSPAQHTRERRSKTKAPTYCPLWLVTSTKTLILILGTGAGETPQERQVTAPHRASRPQTLRPGAGRVTAGGYRAPSRAGKPWGPWCGEAVLAPALMSPLTCGQGTWARTRSPCHAAKPQPAGCCSPCFPHPCPFPAQVSAQTPDSPEPAMPPLHSDQGFAAGTVAPGLSCISLRLRTFLRPWPSPLWPLPPSQKLPVHGPCPLPGAGILGTHRPPGGPFERH